MSEIGIDIDHDDRVIVKDIILKIMLNYKPQWLRLFVSPSKRGYHIKFKISRNYSPRTLIRIRKSLGDDPNRIKMVGGEYRDVLFDVKVVNGKKMFSREIDPLKFIKTGKRIYI